MSETSLLPDAALPDVYREKVAAQTQRFHVGLYPNGPAWNQTFHGINFPQYTSKFEGDTEFKREGDVVDLTTAQLRQIREAIANRIVRWNKYPADYRDAKKAGTVQSAQIFDVRCRGFEPERGDEPLVKYVYLKPAPVEFVPGPPAAATFAALDDAIKAAEEREMEAATDPADAKTRKDHGALRALGQTLGDSGAI